MATGWFVDMYMCGDLNVENVVSRQEFVPQDVELADSGKILSSFHYIKDVSIVSEMASIIGDVNMSNVYGSLAQRLIEKFNSIYLSTNHSRPAPPRYDLETYLFAKVRAHFLLCYI